MENNKDIFYPKEIEHIILKEIQQYIDIIYKIKKQKIMNEVLYKLKKHLK
jgi:hypothetical protein